MVTSDHSSAPLQFHVESDEKTGELEYGLRVVTSGQDPIQLGFQTVGSEAYAAKGTTNTSELCEPESQRGPCSTHAAELGSFGHTVSGFKDTGGKLWNLTLWLKDTEARHVAGELLYGGRDFTA